MFAATSNAIVRALLAPMCASCDQPLRTPLNGPICPSCWSGIELIGQPSCTVCGDALGATIGAAPDDRRCSRCRTGATAFDLARAAGTYSGGLRDMIHALKYRRRRMIAPHVSERMRREGAIVLVGADAVVPVPLHPWRQWQRGFNQADDLARGLGLPVWRALRRVRGGIPQANLPVDARQANAEGAYAVAWREQWRPQRWRRLEGATVVLVDDVLTSGATLNACARVLRGAGARQVRALTAARAVAERPLQFRQTPHPWTARR